MRGSRPPKGIERVELVDREVEVCERALDLELEQARSPHHATDQRDRIGVQVWEHGGPLMDDPVDVVPVAVAGRKTSAIAPPRCSAPSGHRRASVPMPLLRMLSG